MTRALPRLVPRKSLRLVQLPVPPPAAFAATGNVPLAAGCLGVAAQVHGFSDRVGVEVVAPSLTDSLGDTELADRIAADEPDVLGLSLYLWNVERSLHLAREVKKRSPRTQVWVGGPEVSADNTWLQQQKGYDLAVSGEGEETLVELLEHSLAGRELAGLSGVSVRTTTGLTPFGPKRAAKFPLSQYPSPYLAGLVPWDPFWEAHYREDLVETDGGVRQRASRDAVVEDLQYAASTDVRALWHHAVAQTLLVRAGHPFAPGADIITEADRDAFLKVAPRAKAVEVPANHYGVMNHPHTARAVQELLT